MRVDFQNTGATIQTALSRLAPDMSMHGSSYLENMPFAGPMILSRGVKDSTDKFELRAGRFRDQKGHDVSFLVLERREHSECTYARAIGALCTVPPEPTMELIVSRPGLPVARVYISPTAVHGIVVRSRPTDALPYILFNKQYRPGPDRDMIGTRVASDIHIDVQNLLRAKWTRLTQAQCRQLYVSYMPTRLNSVRLCSER